MRGRGCPRYLFWPRAGARGKGGSRRHEVSAPPRRRTSTERGLVCVERAAPVLARNDIHTHSCPIRWCVCTTSPSRRRRGSPYSPAGPATGVKQKTKSPPPPPSPTLCVPQPHPKTKLTLKIKKNLSKHTYKHTATKVHPFLTHPKKNNPKTLNTKKTIQNTTP